MRAREEFLDLLASQLAVGSSAVNESAQTDRWATLAGINKSK